MLCDFGQNLKMTKTSKFCPIHQKNICKSYLQFEFDHLDWISNFYSEWRQTSKSVNFQDFCLGPSIRFRSKFEND